MPQRVFEHFVCNILSPPTKSPSVPQQSGVSRERQLLEKEERLDVRERSLNNYFVNLQDARKQFEKDVEAANRKLKAQIRELEKRKRELEEKKIKFNKQRWQFDKEISKLKAHKAKFMRAKGLLKEDKKKFKKEKELFEKDKQDFEDHKQNMILDDGWCYGSY